MARHLFKPWRGDDAEYQQRPAVVRSVSLCGRVFSTREAQAATEGQHARAGDCWECERERLKEGGDGVLLQMRTPPG
jgi:hypothetical protein